MLTAGQHVDQLLQRIHLHGRAVHHGQQRVRDAVEEGMDDPRGRLHIGRVHAIQATSDGGDGLQAAAVEGENDVREHDELDRSCAERLAIGQ